MQHWLPEKLVETRRDDFRREIEEINLINEVENAYEAQQSLSKKLMYEIGNWMTGIGEQLKDHNQAPDPLPRWYQGNKLAR